MGQVPTSATKSSSILVIGSGRMARHLIQYFNLLSEQNHNLQNPQAFPQILNWSRKQPVAELVSLLSRVDTVLLAISDSAIHDFYQQHLKKFVQLSEGKTQDHKVVHFSGALHFAEMACAHPLMTFAQELYPLEFYQRIHFTITGASTLNELIPGLQNHYSQIAPEQKALYHSLCVISGNFPQILWAHCLEEMQKLNIPKAALDLYVAKTSENFVKLGAQALTGPIARGDMQTLTTDYRALNDAGIKSVFSAVAKLKGIILGDGK